MISKCKKNYKLAVAFILGIIVSGLVVYAATIESSNISYDNSSSGLSSTTLKGAIDELYSKIDNSNFKAAYSYNASTCVTGEESTCQKTTCYKNKTAGSCKAGDIIEYQVNSSEKVVFHVMYDKGDTIVMQSQQNIVEPMSSGSNTTGPTTVIEKIESATTGWTNVNNQTYTMGTTAFVGGNSYTGCSTSTFVCEKNIYTWNSRTARARMITIQEATNLGCTTTTGSCPSWMASGHENYWTMNGGYSSTDTTSDPRYMFAIASKDDDSMYKAYFKQSISSGFNFYGMNAGANAVVVVSK